MRFGRQDALAFAPEANDDDIADNRSDPKKRDNRPGIRNPYVWLSCVFITFYVLHFTISQ